MIVFDEFKINDDEDLNRLKRYANQDQAIEMKGQDIGATEKTYNSFIICNNAITDMRIAWDDRRFSVTDITKDRLDSVWSLQEMEDFVEIVSNPNSREIRNFGYWLLNRKPASNEFFAYKRDHFYKLCYSSLTAWEKLIVDKITGFNTSDLYEIGELRILYKEAVNGQFGFPKVDKIKGFLENYQHLGKDYLGWLEEDERTQYIRVNPVFVKSNKDSTGVSWQDIL